MMSYQGIQALLSDHHHALEGACLGLLARTFADEPDELIAEYRQFERGVLEHIEAEEEALVPAYATSNPDDARAVHEEHAILRRLLLQLAVDVELHAIRADHVVALVDQLRSHAEREEHGLYAWFGQSLLPVHKRRVFRRIAASLRELTGKRQRDGVDVVGSIEHTGYTR